MPSQSLVRFARPTRAVRARGNAGASARVRCLRDNDALLLVRRSSQTRRSVAVVKASSGDETSTTSTTRKGTLTVRYHRRDGAYAGWGAHAWGEGVATPTSWDAPLERSSTVDEDDDASWVRFEVETIAEGGKVSVLIHKGEEQDCRAEELDCGVCESSSSSSSIWLVSGYSGVFTEEPDLDALPKGDIDKQRALWIAEGVVAIPPDFASAEEDCRVEFSLVSSRSGSMTLTGKGVGVSDDDDDASMICLTATLDDFPPSVKSKFPHVVSAGYRLLTMSADAATKRRLLQRRLAVAAVDADTGSPIDATGVQMQGAIDDMCAYDGPLGADFDAGKESITLRVWAPTAQTVALVLHDAPREGQSVRVGMTRDDATGVWSATGDYGKWHGKYYNYEVEVFNPTTGRVSVNVASDPYARSLAADGRRAQIYDVDGDESLKPDGWDRLSKPEFTHPVDGAIYELHIRDFSAMDATVSPSHRGKYCAFEESSSVCVSHLRTLSDAGLTHVHLLPSYDFGSVPELKENQLSVDFDELARLPPDSAEQQEAVSKIAWSDGFNWGYDPVHYGVPEGSYSTNPDGPQRIVEYRRMVKSLASMGLRVVCDVVYNHTLSSGPSDVNSVLDKIVPGYYHRRNFDGIIEASTCCNNTASEHYMMSRLIVDDLVHWARTYKVDGFRFDLMGHLMLSTMIKAKEALQSLTIEKDGVDGGSIYLYGEGWDYAEVAQGRVGRNASQLNLANTGIGSFNDRVREGCIGGSPFGDPRLQGFLTGLYYTPNGAVDQGDEDSQRYRMMEDGEKIVAALAGNVKDFSFVNRHGIEVPTSSAAWPNSNVGYAGEPAETVNYVSAHDNETLFDSIVLRAASTVSLEDRCRINHVATAIIALSQGVPFFHAGDEILRSKSLDRDSYSSGDWFNRLDYSGETHNFGIGLPGAQKNGDRYPFIAPMLANTEMRPSKELIRAATKNFCELLSIRRSTSLLRLRSTREIKRRMKFYNRGPAQHPGLIVAAINDGDASTRPGLGVVDDNFRRLVIAFNATPNAISHEEADLLVDFAGVNLELHPLAGSLTKDERTLSSTFNEGILAIPPYTWAVFVQRR